MDIGSIISAAQTVVPAATDAKAAGVLAYTWATYAWVFVLSIAGGVVNFHNKLSSGKVRAFNFTEFLGECVTSAFAGVLTFWLCEAAGVNQLVTAAFVGLSGHMGARLVFKLEQLLERWFDTYQPSKRSEPTK